MASLRRQPILHLARDRLRVPRYDVAVVPGDQKNLLVAEVADLHVVHTVGTAPINVANGVRGHGGLGQVGVEDRDGLAQQAPGAAAGDVDVDPAPVCDEVEVVVLRQGREVLPQP